MSDDVKIPTSLVPPGVKDKRQDAFVKTLDTVLGKIDIQSLVMSDVWTVDASLLPSLIVEFSMQDYIEPGLDEQSVRGLLANAFEIKAKNGFVAGARLGLSVLGMRAEWIQWYQQEPKGPHDTHQVIVSADRRIFDNDTVLLSERMQRQALRMINATKRWSQEHSLSFRLGGVHVLGISGVAALSVPLSLRGVNDVEIEASGALSMAGAMGLTVPITMTGVAA